MDNVVWVGGWQNVVALTIKDEKIFDATQLFTLLTPEIEPDHMRTRKIPEDTCPPVAWRAEKGQVRSFENLAFLCCFLGGLLGVSSFRKATPEAGAAASREQSWVLDHTRYRDVNIAAHQLLEGIKR